MVLSTINRNLKELEKDFLYHLGLDTDMDLKGIFGDTKFVCMFGSAERAEKFAEKAGEQLGLQGKAGPVGKTERFSLFKIGPVVSVSHGMGMPSILILLHEITKLLHYAGCENFSYVRIGTSGGLGLEPGTVVITNEAMNENFEPVFEHLELGKKYRHPTRLDKKLAEGLFGARGEIRAVVGKTMGTDDFYEGQGRLDGALHPNYSQAEKLEFLSLARTAGILNIEMECTAFAAFCNRAGIPGAVACTTLLDRLKGDQVTSTHEQLAGFSDNAQRVVLNWIKSRIS